MHDLARAGQVPALVLGSGNTALGAIRSLGRAGVPQFCASPAPDYERASRWYRPVHGLWLDDSLERNLRRCGHECAVLIPTSDKAALAATSLPTDLKQRFPSSTAGVELLRDMTDKRRLDALLERHGVPRPRTWALNSEADIEALDDAVLEHAFLKPRDSNRFEATFGKKALRPAGRAAIRHAFVQAAEAGFEMILQEYIAGPPTNCYLIDGFVDSTGEVRGLFARRRLRQHPPDFGNSTALESVPREVVAEAEEILRAFLKSASYRGIFNAEFKIDARDGGFRLFEVNPRAWWYVEFATRCGVDTVTMSYWDALGVPVDTIQRYDTGRTVIYPYYDLISSRAMLADGKIRRTEIVRSWLTSEQMIYAADDPRPFLVATSKLWRNYLGRRLPPGARTPA